MKHNEDMTSLLATQALNDQGDLHGSIRNAMRVYAEDYSETLRIAAEEFVQRCENGEVRSSYTYKLFKDLLRPDESN